MITLPHEFITRTEALIGTEQFHKLTEALEKEPPVSIRINSGKGVCATGEKRVPWCDTGYYLPERLSFTFDPLFHAGTYYVQEASSMFLEQAIRQYVSQPVRCLDLCAAPGGKSTHLASVLPEGSLLVSNEVIRNRSHILAENMIKWGNPNGIVTHDDPEKIGSLTHFFDIIVADVPCSGEGMFRKDPDSVREWSIDNVNLCAARQRRIVSDVWEALKPGGLFIYSTCTYNTEENEENIHYITNELGAEALTIPVCDEWEITGALKYDYPVYRFFPHKTCGEGFFLAILRKNEEVVKEIRPKQKNKKEKRESLPPIPSSVYNWIREPENYHFRMQGNTILATPCIHSEAVSLIKDRLHTLAAGVRLGEIKGKDIVPDQALALHTQINKNAFRTYAVEWEDTIHFLRKEALSFPDLTQKGYILLTYKGYPLGFVKNIGNRANNLYPQEWRIRSGYMPESPVMSPVKSESAI